MTASAADRLAMRLGGAVAALLLGAGTAGAAQGPGLRAGDLVIHPSAWVAGGYDNNVFYDSDDDVLAPPNPATVLKVGAGISAENRNPNKVLLRLGTALSYRHFASVDEADGDAIDERVVEARNGLDSVDANLLVGILPRATVSLELAEDFRYTERPAYEITVAGFEKIDNAVGADLRFRPGENRHARAFETRLGYRFRIVRFLDSAEVGATRAEKDAHETRLLTTWKFLPKTALLAEARWHVNDYSQGRNELQDRDSRPLEVLVGLRGLVTPRLSTTLKIGYGNTFNVRGDSYSGPIGTAELQYALEPTLRLTAGYERDARDTNFSNFYVLDRVYGQAELFFLTYWSLGGKIGFDNYDYSRSGAPPNSEKREDPVLRSAVALGFHPRDWLTVELSWELDRNYTDFRTVVVEEGGDLPADARETQYAAEYSKQVVLLRVEAKY